MATSLDDVGLLFDDIATYTKLTSIKSSGLVVDDLAAIANFTNETTSDILKQELKMQKQLMSLNIILKTWYSNSTKIFRKLENIRQNAILESKRRAASRELPIVYKIALGSFKKQVYHYSIVLLMSSLAPWLIALF